MSNRVETAALRSYSTMPRCWKTSFRPGQPQMVAARLLAQVGVRVAVDLQLAARIAHQRPREHVEYQPAQRRRRLPRQVVLAEVVHRLTLRARQLPPLLQGLFRVDG